MLKDAALLHLDAMEELIPKGFWLRDASAFNVQYQETGLRLIDTLSIGRRPSEKQYGDAYLKYKQSTPMFFPIKLPSKRKEIAKQTK